MNIYIYNLIHRKAVERQANNKIGVRRYSDMAKLQNLLSADCSLHENHRARTGSSTLDSKKPIRSKHSLTISRFPVLNKRKPKRTTQTSREATVNLLISRTSEQYMSIGLHLTCRRCKTSSSEPTFRTLLRIRLVARLNLVLTSLTEN
jgi:hypothetical protein